MGPASGAAMACAQARGAAAIMNHKAYAEMPRIGKLQMDMLALAFACDLTRVSTIEWSKSAVSPTVLSWLEINQSHHDISHAGDSDTVVASTS